MSPLTILDWNQTQREVQFVGYSRDFSAGFIRDEEGVRRVVRLRLPHLANIRFRTNPIAAANSPLGTITRTALRRPPCFTSEEQATATRTQGTREYRNARHGSPWKVISGHSCYLEPKDDRKLKQLLGKEKARLRKLYDQRKQELATLPPDHDDRRAFESEFTAIRTGPTKDRLVSVFDVTLDMVREGWAGLREKLLHAEWAKHHGLDLQRLDADVETFHSWLGQHAFNADHTVSDLSTRTMKVGVCLRLSPDEWEALEAAVGYEVRFANGQRCWLDTIEETAVVAPQEIEDFDRLEAAEDVAGNELLTLEQVCRELLTKYGGKTKPMDPKQLQKLCTKLKIPYRFPMRRSVVKMIQTHRQRRRRDLNEQLVKKTTQRSAAERI